jgi:glutamate--cysteine ligase
VTVAPRVGVSGATSELSAEARLDRDALADDLRQRIFPSPSAVGHMPRIGAEVEVLPVDVTTRRPVPLEGRGRTTLAILQEAGAAAGWRARRSAKANVPEIELPDGGRITFEPGGQIEISSAPNVSLSALVAELRATVRAIATAAAPGVELLSLGIDPITPVEEVHPQLDAERYRRMLHHFDRIGPSGARMMRQTASFQVCVDGGENPEMTWRVLNALAPYVVAIFASSPRYAGADTGHRSFRRHVWGTLDPRRTGLLGLQSDPIVEYLEFALDAPAFLLPDVHGRAAPFRYWLERGTCSAADWCMHLTTLFPEVRPRGYFELRSADAVVPEWYAVPLVFVAGLVYHRPTLETVADRLGAPDSELLVRSGHTGLSDPAIAGVAPELCDLALAGCAALGAGFADDAAIAAAAEYFDRYTRRGRSPADD